MLAFTPQLLAPETDGHARDVVVSICRSEAMVFNALRQWHDLPTTPAGWRAAFAFFLKDSLIGVATWGRPVARNEDYEHTLELTRHALAPNCPRNTATFTLGKMRRYIRRQLPEFVRLISYCDMTRHHATMYKADNWRLVDEVNINPAILGWNNRPGRVADSHRIWRTKWEREP